MADDGLEFWDDEDRPMVRQGNLGVTPDDEDNIRPLRDRFESITDRLPSGPFGKIGEGDLVGLGGFIAVEATRPIIQFIPGIKQPGYHVNAHNTDRMDGFERHTLTIQALSEDVAEFVAGYTATPSNIDFATTEVRLVDTEIVTERQTYSTYRIKVDIDERGRIE